MRKIYYENINLKKPGPTILISDKINFRVKKITRDEKNINKGKKISQYRRQNSPTCESTEQPCLKIREAKTDRANRKNPQLQLKTSTFPSQQMK